MNHKATTRRIYADPRYQRARRFILQRDGHVCRYCGGPANTADHVIPLARGGAPFALSNLVASCLSCNSRRGAGPSLAETPGAIRT